MRATETCSCGAKIDLEDKFANNVTLAIEKWRKEHQHTPPYRPLPPYTPVWTSGGAVTASGGTFTINTGEGPEPTGVPV